MPSWDPAQYAAFADHRSRPFADLLGRVLALDPGLRPRLVVDLGCGDGPLTLGLADRYPTARVVGLDSSEAMLARARELDQSGRVEWVNAQVQQWDPSRLAQPVDLLTTNATLQWVPGHLDLVPGWVEALSPGGWFAMQVPANFDAPSHRLMREVAARHERAADLLATLRHTDAVAAPGVYLELLSGLGLVADVWATTYLQVLDPAGAQASPVLEWVRGTGLRPVLDVLTDDHERDAFVTAYAAELDRAYPRRPFGVAFPFRRIFAVGRKPV
ncbi:MAG: methyltransferase domain-containing protein [Actinomycetota bacterium]|nr:methyltransferase domain-containing protein [Actinomycetota bacterium]